MVDREKVLSIVRHDGSMLKYVGMELKDDLEVVMAAVGSSGWSLEHASERLRGERTVVLAAVMQSGLALEYASKELRDDNEIVLAAVKRNPLALDYVGDKIRKLASGVDIVGALTAELMAEKALLSKVGLGVLLEEKSVWKSEGAEKTKGLKV